MKERDVRVLEDVPVFSVVAEGGLDGIAEAWERVEAPLDSLRGRRFYGTYFQEGDEYRACFAAREDDPEFEGLERWVIPGGRYARRKMEDWTDRTDRIGPTVDEMAHEWGDVGDGTRPSVEFYRSQRELILYFPIV